MAGEYICHFFVNGYMHIESLTVTNFRNLSHVKMEFSPAVNILYGGNGAGKTNLLEAIFVLCLGRSQRGAGDPIMLKHSEEVYRIEGRIKREDVVHEVAVAYQRGGRKKIAIDRVNAKTTELYENYCAVSLGPEDTEILSGSPSIRRNFLDIYLSQFSRSYLSHLVDYYKVLTQKNACLRSDCDTAPFNVLLINHGAEVVKARINFIEKLGQAAGRHYAEICREGMLRLSYQPSVPLERGQVDADGIKQSFETALIRQEERERALKSSLIGPHRDEILFQIGDYPARTHGSQGEWRTAAIAVKLAVYQLLKDKRRMQPVLLLDEIFTELDRERSTALMQSFSEFGQLFVTTAVDPPESLRRSGRSFRIHQGTVRQIS